MGILRRHLPPQAVEWVYTYAERHSLYLHVTRQRTTKLGDYRWPQMPKHPYHEISVNGDLNPYMFFLVFLHEAAHLETYLKYPRTGRGRATVQPHGHEWQAEYAQLLAARSDCFPIESQPLLARYVSRVPLSRAIGRELEDSLRCYDANTEPVIRLDSLPLGTLFRPASHPGKVFRSIERRRTRWICLEPSSGRRYLVSGHAAVEKIDEQK